MLTQPNQSSSSLRSRTLSIVMAASLLCAFTAAAVQRTDRSRACSLTQPASDRDYIMAVVPFLPAERLELSFGPLAARFGEVLERDVYFRSASGAARFAENLSAETYDFALLSSVLWAQADAGAYVPLARIPGTFTGEFVTLEDSPLQSVEDLRGRRLVLIQVEGVDVLARYTLQQLGLDLTKDVSIRRVENALSCPQQLLAGTADVCAATFITRQRFSAQMNVELKVIGKTVAAPNALLVAHRRVPEVERDLIRDFMMTWRDDPDNDTGVPGVSLPNLVPFTSEDYDPLFEVLRVVEAPRTQCR